MLAFRQRRFTRKTAGQRSLIWTLSMRLWSGGISALRHSDIPKHGVCTVSSDLATSFFAPGPSLVHLQSCLRRPVLPRRMQVSSSTALHHRASCTPATPIAASSCFAAAPRYAVLRQQVHAAQSSLLKSQRLTLSSKATLAGHSSWSLVARCLPLMQRARKSLLVRAGVETSASVDDPAEANKRAQVAKRLERTADYFKRLGSWGFWTQLICSVISAVILAFSLVITGSATAPVSLYLTTAGIVAAFLSVFWSFGYIRLAQKLRSSVSNPTKAPPRAEVVKNLRNGIVINLLGLGAAVLGLQATVGALVAKALTSSAAPYAQGVASYSPVLALDVFLVQASGNTILAHFLGLLFSLELLRAVTVAQPPPDNVIPKPA